MSPNVLAFVPHPEAGASGRYRAYQLVEPLRRHGIEFDVHPLLDTAGFESLYRSGSTFAKLESLVRGCRKRWAELAEARRYDLVFVHREVWPFLGPQPVRRLTAHQPRWVYDFDDAVWLPNVSEANQAYAWLKPTDQFARLAAGAQGVSAGNTWLAEWAHAQRPGRERTSVEVIPTAVDTRRWSPRPRPEGPPRLVWIGSHSTVHYLAPLRPLLAALAARHPGLELHVVGARFATAGIRVIEHEWSVASEVDATAACDIGLAPLPDDPWTRGKCGLKLLLYMALGLPAVASRVGVHSEIIEDGVSGRLVDTEAGFVATLDALLDDRAERRRLGENARARVETRYSVEAVAPRLAALLQRAAG